jgi:hypothetical protein
MKHILILAKSDVVRRPASAEAQEVGAEHNICDGVHGFGDLDRRCTAPLRLSRALRARLDLQEAGSIEELHQN